VKPDDAARIIFGNRPTEGLDRHANDGAPILATLLTDGRCLAHGFPRSASPHPLARTAQAVTNNLPKYSLDLPRSKFFPIFTQGRRQPGSEKRRTRSRGF
jgi:hypothetical protein